MMAAHRFIPGQSGNPTGRPKNSKNKATEDLRMKISDFLDENWDRVQADFNRLGPEKRLNFLEKLLKFCVPPKISVDLRREVEALTDQQLDELAEKILNRENYD